MQYFYDHIGVAGFKYGGAFYYYQRDIQNNVTAILDSNGTVVVKYTYNAWGYHTVSDTSGNSLGTKNPFRYRSYFYDTETKLYYLKTRYYDPEVGRFINMDSIQYADTETVNGLNLYAYCNNNPVNNIDPTGYFAISITVGLISLFALATTAYIENEYHLIQDAVENVGNAIGNLANDISNSISNNETSYNSLDKIQSSISPNNSLNANSMIRTADNIILSREKNNGHDTALRGKTNQELEDMLNDAKRMHDSKMIQRILKEMKMRGMRNVRKQRGGPHMRGLVILLALMGGYLSKNYEDTV